MVEEMMNIRQAAEYTGIEEIKLWNLANNEEVPVIKDRWHWKFEKSTIDEWLMKRKPV